MGFSRSARIKTLLVIDGLFFFIELTVGYAVGSLALVADSFHMLNDVCSLIVALYALKLAEQTTRSSKYSYGWQRAEILGALINGVFLLALCFSIFLEAIQRLFEAPEVGQPKLVVVVGSLGLLSNIVGLFLFHEHGHSHGPGGHSHSHGGADAHAEEGHSHAVKAKGGKGGAGPGHSHSHGHKLDTHTHANGDTHQADERTPLLGGGSGSGSGSGTPAPVAIGSGAQTPATDLAGSDGEEDQFDELLVHPARTREAIVRQAYDQGFGSPREGAEAFGHRRTQSAQSAQGRPRRASLFGFGARRDVEETPAAQAQAQTQAGAAPQAAGHQHAEGAGHAHHDHSDDHEHEHGHVHEPAAEEDDHGHAHGQAGGHGHSHGNMNMRGVFLHVLGDALGNVGVIGAGLIIWLSRSPWRFYSDPLISLIITVIIFSSALPLVRSASFILLQGTPAHVPLEKVRGAVLRIPGVISVHDLHVWSLSESKLVASLHVLVKNQEEFGRVSGEIRRLLHRFGVHSSTIQPELLEGAAGGGPAHGQNGGPGGPGAGKPSYAAVAAGGGGGGSADATEAPQVQVDIDAGDGACTVQCVDDSCVDSACCPPAVAVLAKNSQASLRPSGHAQGAEAGHKH